MWKVPGAGLPVCCIQRLQSVILLDFVAHVSDECHTQIKGGMTMILETNTTDRKVLVHHIAEILNAKPEYAGMPSCAYRIGAVTIDKQGNIILENTEMPEALKPFLIEQGFLTNTEPEPTTTIERMEISVPAEMTVEALANLTFLLYSKQYLMNRAVGSGFLVIPEVLISRLQEDRPDSPDAFSGLLNEYREQDALDGFDYQEGKATLSFPFDEHRPELWAAYANLLNRIVTAAQCAARVQPKLQKPENEKYFMRSWLLRLGYGGEDMKTERKLLLANLNGSAAFPIPEAAERHKEKYAKLRRQTTAEQPEA
jgi:hypothetical protein